MRCGQYLWLPGRGSVNADVVLFFLGFFLSKKGHLAACIAFPGVSENSGPTVRTVGH